MQSGYIEHQSTETVLTTIISDLRLNTDENKVSILILFDLSATFDMMNHGILINQSSASLGDHMSEKHDNCFGITKGSCLGPFIFL